MTSGNRQYILDYNGSKIYPYTKIDCILDVEDVPEGEQADYQKTINGIVKNLLSDSIVKNHKDVKDGSSYLLGYNISGEDSKNRSFINVSKLTSADDNDYKNHGIFCSNGVFKKLSLTSNLTFDNYFAGSSLTTSISDISTDSSNLVLNTSLNIKLNLNKEYFGGDNELIVTHANHASTANNAENATLADVAKTLKCFNENISVGSDTTPIYWDGINNAFVECNNIKIHPSNVNLADIQSVNAADDDIYTVICYKNKNTAAVKYFNCSGYFVNNVANIGDKGISFDYINTKDILKDINKNAYIDLKYLKTFNDSNEFKDEIQYILTQTRSTNPTTGEQTYVTTWSKNEAVINITKPLAKDSTITNYFLTGCTYDNVSSSVSELACSISSSKNTGIYFKTTADGENFNTKLYQTSDETLKTFTSDIDINFDNLATIKKGEFYWNDDANKTPDLGVSAQTVEALYPQIVDDVDGIKSVSYDRLGVIALAAIDKLHIRIKTLEKEIKKLKKELSKK